MGKRPHRGTHSRVQTETLEGRWVSVGKKRRDVWFLRDFSHTTPANEDVGSWSDPIDCEKENCKTRREIWKRNRYFNELLSPSSVYMYAWLLLNFNSQSEWHLVRSIFSTLSSGSLFSILAPCLFTAQTWLLPIIICCFIYLIHIFPTRLWTPSGPSLSF